MDRDNVIKTIQHVLNEEQNVIFAYLFGSVATGKVHKESDDVDIAVCFSSVLSKLERFDLRLKMTDQLVRALSTDVDMVDLASAPLKLRHRIMLEGILICEKSKPDRVDFEVYSRREYFDFARHLERRTNAMLSKF